MAAESKAGGSKDNKKAVFIGNLHLKTEDDELRAIFTDCGSIHSVRIIRDQATGLGKGFGYVNFETSDAVELALKKSDLVDLRNRTLRISRCVKKLKSNTNTSNFNGSGSNTKNPKLENGNDNKPKSFGGDRLAEIGKLKRKSKGGNIGEKKKASVARQLAGTSRPRPPKRTKRSQGGRQRPKPDGGSGNKPPTVSSRPRPQGQGQGQDQGHGKRPGQSQRKSWNNAKPTHAKGRQGQGKPKTSSGRYFK